MHYVSPDGVGNGSFESPSNLSAYASNAGVKPGHTLYLRAGTYTGQFVFTLQGAAGNMIRVLPYPGEAVVIDGSISGGAYVHFQDFVIDDSRLPGTEPFYAGVETIGEGNEYYYLTVKNHNQGFSGGNDLVSYKIHGCNVYYNGQDDGFGHGLYIQHEGDAAWVDLSCNLVHNNFGWGFHLYGTHVLRRFRLDRNVAFQNGEIASAPQPNIMVGGTAGVDQLELLNNRTWRSSQDADGIRVNYGVGNTASNITMTDNFNVSTLRLVETIAAATLTDNLQYGVLEPSTLSDTYPSNTYDIYANLPDTVFLDALEDADRANLTVYNPSQANTVNVDVSSLFGISGTVKAYNALDPLVDVQTLTITAGVIAVDMQAANRSVETPVGYAPPASTFPNFGAFRLVLQ